MPYRRTADARVSVNGTFVGLSRIRFSGKTSSIPVTNTEGKCGNPANADARGKAAKIADIDDGGMEITFPAFNDDDNPFASPVNLRMGNYYDLECLPAGGGEAWSGNCLCVSVEGSGQIPGGMPIVAIFETDGDFDLPT